jgi:hypothetical protein
VTKLNKTEVFQVKKRRNVNLLIKETIMENFNEPFDTFYSTSNNLFQKGNITLHSLDSNLKSLLNTQGNLVTSNQLNHENKIWSSKYKKETIYEIKDANLSSKPRAEKSVQDNEKESIIYLGKDIVDRIYNCPNNRSISFECPESEKVGLLLLGKFMIR